MKELLDKTLMMESPVGSEVIINGRKVLYFGGAGYFQLQNHPAIIEAAVAGLQRNGITAATSRAISGTTKDLYELELNLAAFFGTESAVYLPSGYLSNMAGLTALVRQSKATHLLIDELAHYCLVEAAQMCQLPIQQFRHCRPDDLESYLKHLPAGSRPIILSDGMFPVWGNLAPLDVYLSLAEQYNALIWIDDAHSVGINGDNGRGSYESLQISSNRLFMGATLSKAFGAYGGFVVGSADFIQQVKQSTVVKGTTAPLSAAIAAGNKAIELVKSNPQWRTQLWSNARYLRKQLKAIGMDVIINNSPIVTVSFKDAAFMSQLQQQLLVQGIYIQYLDYMGAGADGVLRMVVSSQHEIHQMDALVEKFKHLL